MMAMDQTEEQEDAVALLVKCRHKLTGREEAICERIARGEAAGDEGPEATYDDAGDLINYTDGCDFVGFPTRDEQPLFDSLRNQFSREIAAWKDGVRA